MKHKEKTWSDIKVNDEASFDKVITEEDISKFAEISGDYNPLHIEDGVVHGMLMGALVSRLVGMDLPGRHAMLLKESLEFKKLVKAGERLKVFGKVMFKSEGTRVIELNIEINNDKSEILASGTVHVKVLK